jgi:heterodisulfide reductase subunit C
MLMQYKLTSRDLFSDLDMGLDMFLKGKIHLLPKRIEGRDQMRKLFELGRRQP